MICACVIVGLCAVMAAVIWYGCGTSSETEAAREAARQDQWESGIK